MGERKGRRRSKSRDRDRRSGRKKSLADRGYRGKAFISTTFAGVFALDEENKILDYKKFPKDVNEIANKLKESGSKMIKEERELMDQLRKKYDLVFKADKVKDQYVRENLRKLATKYNFVKTQTEFNQILSKVNVALTKLEIKKAVGRDSLILQVNGAVEELDKSINILVERLREWYGLHFPEMDRAVESHEKFAKTVEQFGSREKIEDAILGRLKDRSMGIDLNPEDSKTVQEFAKKISELYELRASLEDYLDKLMKEVAPNFQALAGSKVGAKLIARAGGLNKLARMPSSTIQLLGAEKALFRHLKGRGRSPKHGIISTHPLVQSAPKELRGKIARALASKLSIAAKVDQYSKDDRIKKLKKELDDKIGEILKSASSR